MLTQGRFAYHPYRFKNKGNFARLKAAATN
jgi:hypothetical protein